MGAVSVGQAPRVDDMVVGDKVEDKDKDENKDTAEEEEKEDAGNAEEVESSGTKKEEEDKDDKDNEGGEAELELSRLKKLVPSVCVKDNVSQLDVILEAIRYISSLQGKLADRIEAGDVVPVLVNNTS